MADAFDLIVIGSGPGGYVAAIRAAQLGMKVACVEKEKTLGGTCLNVGCIPSKAMLESSHNFIKAKHELKEHGISVGDVKLDLSVTQKRRETVVTGITSGVDFLFKKNKITRFTGRGFFKSAKEIGVESAGNSEFYQAKNIIIASGSVPIELASMPFDHKLIVDSADALAFDKVPEKLVIVGGGVIGLELGSVWNRLGSEVIVLEALPQLLGTMDEGVSKAVQKFLAKQGIKFHLETKVEGAKKSGAKVKITAKTKDSNLELEADKLLVAIGRKANTQGLALDAAGVKLDSRGRVEIDDNFRTTAANVYAIGDVVKGAMLAHKAEEEGVACAEIIAGHKAKVNYDAVAGIVYTWPEIASVGATEASLKEKKIPYKVGNFFVKANGRARAMGESEGFVKILADEKNDRLLGAHIVCANASEMISELVMAMEFGASAEDVARAVHAHPTLVECIKEACLDVDKHAIHS